MTAASVLCKKLSTAMRRPLIVALCISVAFGLALSGELIFQEWAQERWKTNPDSVIIATAGQRADFWTALHWWGGPWIGGPGFYRPLSSMLMWLEAKLWGFHFFPYTLVSWLMHALNSGLLCLLLYSVCPGPRWQRALVGTIGALMFNLGKHPSGPDWIEARVAWGVMIYWPAQTDLGSLGGSLASLICLDRYLCVSRTRLCLAPPPADVLSPAGQEKKEAAPAQPHRWLIAALGCFLAALLFKETALALVVLAPLLAVHRNAAWRRIALYYGLVGVAFLVVRALALPVASNPQWLGLYTFYKWLSWTHLLTAQLLQAGEIWEYVTIVTLIPAVLICFRHGVRFSYILLGCLLWPFVVGGLLTGNPAIATIPRELTILVRFAGVYGGFALALLTVNREPLLLFVSGLCVIAVAHINRIGPHYWYWPVAFWGLCNGAAANAVLNVGRAYIQQFLGLPKRQQHT